MPLKKNLAFAEAIGYITTYRMCYICIGWPFFLPDAQRVAIHVCDEIKDTAMYDDDYEYAPPLHRRDIQRIESTYTGRHGSNDSSV